MMVVIADSRLVAGDRPRRLDTAEQSGIGQCRQNVVDGLSRHLGKTEPHRTKDGVGVGVRMAVHRIENRDAWPRHPKVAMSQLLSEFRRGRHALILSGVLE